jgi:hypothetical protein
MVVDEEGSDDAVILARYQMMAPDLLRVECANALCDSASLTLSSAG